MYVKEDIQYNIKLKQKFNKFANVTIIACNNNCM